MQRTRMVLLMAVVVAVLLVWIGTLKSTVAQPAQASFATGRYTIALTSGGAGTQPEPDYWAILLDTQTGKAWGSTRRGGAISGFKPLQGGPADEHMKPAERTAP